MGTSFPHNTVLRKRTFKIALKTTASGFPHNTVLRKLLVPPACHSLLETLSTQLCSTETTPPRAGPTASQPLLSTQLCSTETVLLCERLANQKRVFFPHNSVLRKQIVGRYRRIKPEALFPHNSVLRKHGGNESEGMEGKPPFHTTLFYGNPRSGTLPLTKVCSLSTQLCSTETSLTPVSLHS